MHTAFSCIPLPHTYKFISLGGLWTRVLRTIYAYCILLHLSSSHLYIYIFSRFMNTSTENYIRMLHSLASSVSLLHIYIFRRFVNTSTENYICILHSLASSFSPLHIYIFRRFVNTSTENFTRILHSLASSFSPLHIYFFWPQLHALTFPALCLNPTRNLPTSTLTYSHWLPKLLHSVVQYVLTVLLNK